MSVDGCLDITIPIDPVLRECKDKVTPEISVRTLARYWKIYEEWGLLPCDVQERIAKLRKFENHSNENAVSKEELMALKEIVDEDPSLYLDEISLRLGMETGRFLSRSYISRLLRLRLRYSLKVMCKIAKQRRIEEEVEFLLSMSILIDGDPTKLVIVDECFKDDNAARRGLGWSLMNVPCEFREMFIMLVRYALLAACDINGFIPQACHCVLRDRLSDEGAAGTVDREYFLYWVKTYLCPTLGNFSLGEPRSVVFMDNASTHMTAEVVYAIESTGAVLIYGAPYSPHLSPIEKYFSIYKAYLKRNEHRMREDWELVHLEALNQVDRDKGINIFRHC
eukprot:CAMPEP_0178944888 /NCGR_PEP_ID=MMETSP0789-20121207/3413_1 /TAXON_ID=3005 /ORGANISM="Rhizosolenia setigera, Strain CCMP 1694" /LENGTH=336 /DNA_ID=CAMNT_0020624685 /DNA_START=268 /DNA_END=1275 /DNA_ORIENTATION=+